ncbi:MAG: 23S rRNA (adenine(2503)-C(2))-methyltransferase RlmN [Synergistes sp.]|nr:23S rRNA (adenine(2503)-C(2))-methyltransferase RlmN [Synergistes sp.]
MNEKRYALDLNCEEWREYIEKGLGEPKFRADQICQWLWQKHTDSADGMTNLSKALREKLDEKFDFAYPEVLREQRSSDGTKKFLWRLRDGETVESVLMKQEHRLTACISTQVGCPLGCLFCATGLSGFVRSLSAGEIAGQVLAIEKAIGREINNVVYMGMGEPFLNTEEVLRSVRMLNDPKMRGLGIRHITISTSGIIPGIEELAESGLGVRLALSLHAADDELRSMLMPVNQTYPLAEVRKALQQYQEKTGDRITIEYALFGGVNESVERARELARFLKGIHVFVNLIPCNSVDDRFQKPKAEDVLRFRSVLQSAGFETEIRAEQGADIDAACGQLRRKSGSGEEAPLEKIHFPRTEAKEEESEEPARPRRNVRSPKSGAKVSGGYIAERGKRGGGTQERYRSGKMKEARPTYRGGREEDNEMRRERPNEKTFKPRGGADEKGPRRERSAAERENRGGEKRAADTRRQRREEPHGAFAAFWRAPKKARGDKKRTSKGK